MASLADTLHTRPPAGGTRRMLGWAATLLVAVSWGSAAFFGAYILAFYGGAVPHGRMDQWNAMLPGIWDVRTPLAALAIGAHFLTGGILLLLGPVQLIPPIRARIPRLHRWLGRAYVVSAGLAGAGGLGFIAGKGTIGGAVMNVGFGLYGALTVLAATQTWRHALARRYGRHRAWGIRLFALAIGSWLYRMEYGFWLPLTGRLGHAHDFSGWFDHAMAFAFYLPNLLVAELFIRARGQAHPGLRVAASGVLVVASALVLVGTWYFATLYWGPGIAGFFTA